MRCMNLFNNFRDFSNFKICDEYDLGGVTPKLVVSDNKNNYLLKFGKEKENIVLKDYLSEFIACKIAKILQYDVQEVELGYYNNKECVAIKIFPYDIITFTGFGSSTDDEDFIYDLDMLLTLPFNKDKFELNELEFRQYVWRIFVLDMFLGNFDRHENNWGFYKENEIYKTAALYDMGASFYPKLIDNCDSYINNKELEHLIMFNTRSSILYQGKKKNYFELLQIYKNDKILQGELKLLLSKVQKSSFQGPLQTLNSFGYQNYAKFIQRVIDRKVKLLGDICE